jgi:enediyne biosynthesis protein E4
MPETWHRTAAAYLALALLWPRSLLVAEDKKPPPPTGGMASAGVFAAQKDDKGRPITAGGFVDGAPVIFEDVTERSGIGAFQHRSGTPDKPLLLDSVSGGVALIDYDGDGLLDVYLLNGSNVKNLRQKAKGAPSALFRNNGDFTFTDVTEKAGLANERWAFGVAGADYDNDGDTDLYVTNWEKNRLYRNNGDGTFTDVAEAMGVALLGWQEGATWGDYDGDGRLDLFAAGYVDFDIFDPPIPTVLRTGGRYCFFRGEPFQCGPRGLLGARDYLFRNEGSSFRDVSETAGVADPQGYYGFTSTFVDVDDDGRVDLLVANDSTGSFFYRNRADGTFEDESVVSGFAFTADGREQAGMGMAVGDYDNDGRVDVYRTNFSDDFNILLHNEGGDIFEDVSRPAGHATITMPFLGWAAAFMDYDNDGLKDIFVANGHISPVVDRFDWGTTWAQRPLLFRNVDGRRFEPVPAATGSGLAALRSARGTAVGDLDNDGRVDVVMNSCDGRPLVLRNVTETRNHWLRVKLVGGPRGPRDATGATVFVTAGGVRGRQDLVAGSGFCSQSDPRLHFGLGAAMRVDHIEVRWPGGARETFAADGVDRQVTLEQGKGAPAAP